MYFAKMIRFLLRDLHKIGGKMMNSSNHYSFNWDKWLINASKYLYFNLFCQNKFLDFFMKY